MEQMPAVVTRIMLAAYLVRANEVMEILECVWKMHMHGPEELKYFLEQLNEDDRRPLTTFPAKFEELSAEVRDICSKQAANLSIPLEGNYDLEAIDKLQEVVVPTCQEIIQAIDNNGKISLSSLRLSHDAIKRFEVLCNQVVTRLQD
ncbi:MAG TPA: hypothetical protein VJJ80_01715 [Patescibacteria group bacterium]|nr:hypothetical protein [Patescibacteria group bacterium]